VALGGKGASETRKMVMIIQAVDAPGVTCDPGDFSEPTSINLTMVDDDGDVLINSSKTIMCGGTTVNLKRNVFFQGPLNCESSAVPSGSSTGTITSTGTGSAGTTPYVETNSIKCFE
jgi:hypothetical protein